MNKLFWIIFGLFIFTQLLWLGSIPGLLGDEGSEGENVYELLTSEEIAVQGERSYIGPLSDYVRVPFVGLFGYTALALRVPIVVVSVIMFVLAWQMFGKMFGDGVGSMATVAMSFSPVYLTYQRLGWSITLLPLFGLLLIWTLWFKKDERLFWAGLVSGIGLHLHIMFLPVLVSVWVVYAFATLIRPRFSGAPFYLSREKGVSLIVGLFKALIAFWAGFGTQFVILALFKEDQGDPGAVAETISERLNDLPSILQVTVSTSSFIARYTGAELSSVWQNLILFVLGGLIVAGLILSKKRRIILAWLTGLVVNLGVLLYMIDRFTLRYFVIVSFVIWMLAGVGLGEIIERTLASMKTTPPNPLSLVKRGGGAVALALLLILVWLGLVILPFKQSGGSLNDFSLGNRTNSAAALVETRELVNCLRGAGSVTSENVHIFNRLQYLSHQYTDLNVLPEKKLKEAQYLAHYRDDADGGAEELCPNLRHFVVEIK